MTPKMFWSWLGSLVFVITVLWNFMYGIPEPVLVILIGLWSLCFAATIKVDNPIRKKHFLGDHTRRTEPPTKKSWSITLQTKEGPRVLFKPDWMDDETCRSLKHADWLWLEQQGVVQIGPPPGGSPREKVDIGPPFPWPDMDVQEAREKIDRAGRQKFCKHLDKTEITEFGDRQRKFYCMICDKILES